MSKTILLVDDEADARAIAHLALELQTDWTILQASSGQAALQTAARNRPDAILLDMMMPEMDGRTTLQKLKANPETADIPVILVTAKARPLEPSEIESASVVAVLAKPFRPLELAGQIRALLQW
ncbi:MAG: response regulator [Leptolyngbya sp. SIO4C1]|nr:response regulator [Leptolyngbya sp. SIO4C1]